MDPFLSAKTRKTETSRDVVRPSCQTLGLVQSVFEALTRLKFSLIRSRDINLLTGPRIAAFRSSAFADGESSKANQTDFITTLQSVGDGIKNLINSLSCISFGKPRSLRNRSDEIVLIHYVPPRSFTNKRWVSATNQQDHKDCWCVTSTKTVVSFVLFFKQNKLPRSH